MLSTRPAPVAATETESVSLFSILAFGALLGLLLCAPLQLSGFWPASYDFWPQAIFLLLSAGVTLLMALAPDLRVRFDAIAVLLLAFLGWSALAILTSVYRHDSWLEWARVAGALLPFFAVRALWNPKRAPWILSAWALGLAWVCFPAILNFLQTQYPRQAGSFSNNNIFANALAMTLPVALVLPILIWRRTASRLAATVAALPFIFCALGLIVTSSKGGFLAAFVALLVTVGALWCAKKSVIRELFRRHRLPLSGALLVFVIVFGALAGKMILPRLQQARGKEDNSTMFRVYIWRSTLDMVRAKPLLGFGPGVFPHIYPRYAQVSYTRHAHQSWAQIAAENGLPALFFLLGAILLALKTGIHRLATRDWPQSAAMLGAIAALLVHGIVDSGFYTLSVALLLAVALAILTTTDEPISAPRGRINFFWIGVTLVLAICGNLTQKAASAENALFDADQFRRNGAPSLAAQKAQEATNLDPTSARAWGISGNYLEKSGGEGQEALQTAAQLQPTRAANWANLARAAISDGNLSEAERFYARMIEQDPLDTHLRLERAQFLLGAKNSAGYSDLEAILALKKQPYGRYEPIEQIVNLDFARATLLLSPELKKRGQTARLKSLITSALADCARARQFVEQNERMRRETEGQFGSDINADLESLAAALATLQTQLP